MKFSVRHGYYGCECQCEGHRVELLGDTGEIVKERFEFGGPSSNDVLDRAVYANDLVMEFIRRFDLDVDLTLTPIDFHEVRDL